MSLVDLGKRLLESAKHGETEEVRQLMTNGAPFTTDWLGTSPLHMAAQFGHLSTAEVLLRAGISRDARTKVDRTPLHVAAQEGHLEIVELLIKHGADVEAKDMLRMTPLHWAVERGHIPVIQCLLQNGADVNALSKFDKSSVDIAEDNCRTDLMQVLQEYANNPVRSKEEVDAKPVHIISQVVTATPLVKVAAPLTLASIPPVNRSVTSANTASTQSGTALPTSTTTSAPSLSAKTTSSHPILVHTNLTHLQKAAGPVTATKSGSSDSDEGRLVMHLDSGDVSDQSCTNVLATLAALAEATAPNATMSTSEALQWLETHGITMLPADNTTIVASALEGGQTFSLTEAGKLALSWVKEQQNLESTTTAVTTSQENTSNKALQTIANSQNQKVITIVADQSQLPSIINTSSSPTPIVVVSNQNVQSVTDNREQAAKRPRISSISRDLSKPTPNGKVISSAEDAVEEERLKLQRELEEVRRQAEEYRAQLQQKEHEAEQYRKQLEQMRTTSQK